MKFYMWVDYERTFKLYTKYLFFFSNYTIFRRGENVKLDMANKFNTEKVNVDTLNISFAQSMTKPIKW